MSSPQSHKSTKSDPPLGGIFHPEAKEPPAVLLSNFLRSSEIQSSSSAHKTLKEILHDPRWTRLMAERWLLEGPMAKQRLPNFTSDPEHRAVYLVLVSILEERGGGASKSGVKQKEVEMDEEEEEEEKVKEKKVEEKGDRSGPEWENVQL